MTEIESRLNDFLFPVAEREVLVSDGENNRKTKLYKAIVREDNDRLVSIMKNTYKIIPNSEVIKPLLEELNNLDTNWIIDPSHSFVDDSRMRLQVTFPDLTLNDGRSDIALSLFLHNSYDGSEGVRIYWGAIRAICSNGMVFGTVLSKFYGKHTKGIELGNIKEQLQSTYDKIPVLKNRIEILQSLSVTKSIKEDVERKLGKTVSKYVAEQKRPKNQWLLYNILTYYVSHLIEKRLQTAYQIKVSKLFKL